MAPYSKNSLSQKLGIKPDMNMTVYAFPGDYKRLLGRRPVGSKVKKKLTRNREFIHAFFDSQKELAVAFPKLKRNLSKNGMLWISWPKKAYGVKTDLTENVVREIGLTCGLVDVKVAAIDEKWSGLKFVYRLKDR